MSQKLSNILEGRGLIGHYISNSTEGVDIPYTMRKMSSTISCVLYSSSNTVILGGNAILSGERNILICSYQQLQHSDLNLIIKPINAQICSVVDRRMIFCVNIGELTCNTIIPNRVPVRCVVSSRKE